MFFGKHKKDKPDTKVEVHEVDLTELNDPVLKTEKVFSTIAPDLIEHYGLVAVTIGMGLVLNDLMNEMEKKDAGFKKEMLTQMENRSE